MYLCGLTCELAQHLEDLDSKLDKSTAKLDNFLLQLNDGETDKETTESDDDL